MGDSPDTFPHTHTQHKKAHGIRFHTVKMHANTFAHSRRSRDCRTCKPRQCTRHTRPCFLSTLLFRQHDAGECARVCLWWAIVPRMCIILHVCMVMHIHGANTTRLDCTHTVKCLLKGSCASSLSSFAHAGKCLDILRVVPDQRARDSRKHKARMQSFSDCVHTFYHRIRMLQECKPSHFLSIIIRRKHVFAERHVTIYSTLVAAHRNASLWSLQ